MVSVAVDGVDGLNDRVFQILNRLEIVIVDRCAFEVSPETFDQIQVRSISRVPDYRDTFTRVVKKLRRCFGVMDGTVIQEQVNVCFLPA